MVDHKAHTFCDSGGQWTDSTQVDNGIQLRIFKNKDTNRLRRLQKARFVREPACRPRVLFLTCSIRVCQPNLNRSPGRAVRRNSARDLDPKAGGRHPRIRTQGAER